MEEFDIIQLAIGWVLAEPYSKRWLDNEWCIAAVVA
jgi:hypothetical protein